MKETGTCDLVHEIQPESNAGCNDSKQNDEQDLVCKKCKTRFANFVDHVDHSCHPHRCSLCNKLFQSYYELRLHKKMAHRRGTKVNDTLNISLSSTFNQQTKYVSTGASKYCCEICDRPLKKKQSFCKNCMLAINRQGDYNLRDKSVNNPSSTVFPLDKTTNGEGTSEEPLGRSYADISEVLDANTECGNSEDVTNTEKTNVESEKEEADTETSPNKNLSEKTCAQDIRVEKLKSQRGQDISSAGSRLSRKRRLDSDDGNSVPSPKSNIHSGEGHTRSRTSKKIRNNSPVISATKSDMVQIDTLIRSLPDDCGILIKPCNDDDSNFRCPKCSKVFRNFRLGSAHYSLCPKNIECSKNRKTLVSSQDVMWVCSLCHLAFSHLSQLTKHKKSCLSAGPLQPSRNSLPGSEYKSRFRRCPRCSFECVSLIKYQDHPCERLLEHYQSAVVPLKPIRELPEDYSGSYVYFECTCKKIFHYRRVFEQHLQLHPHAKIRDCVRTLYIACNPPQDMNNGDHIQPVIKTEVVSSNDEDYANNVQNTSMAPGVQQAGNSLARRKKKSLGKRKASYGKRILPEQPNAQNSNSSNNQLLNRRRFRRRSVATKVTGDNVAKGIERADNSNSHQNNPSDDANTCTCKSQSANVDKSQSANGNKDNKPCMKCLNDMVKEKTANIPEAPFDFVKLKKEVEDEIRAINEMDYEEAQVDRVNESPNTRDPMDSGLGGVETEIAFQLMKELVDNPNSPSSHRYLTPPATPDSFNVQSPTAREPCLLTNEYASQAGPSRLDVSPNDLASISLEKSLTDSLQNEFIAGLNKTAPFYKQTESFLSSQPQAEPLLPVQLEAEPLLPLQPQAEPLLPLQPQAESLLPLQPQTEPSLPLQPQTEPSLPLQPQTEPLLPLQPQVQPSLPLQPQGEPLLLLEPPAESSLPLQPQGEPSLPLQPQAEPLLSLQPQTEPLLPIPPQVEPSLLLHPQAESSLPFQPQGEPLLLLKPPAESSLPLQPQADPLLQFQLPIFETATEETSTVELVAEREPTPIPPNIRHIHVSKERVIPDAYAMTASDNETVLRYICYHCMLDFQVDSLADHLRNKVGKAPSEEIRAIYVCEED